MAARGVGDRNRGRRALRGEPSRERRHAPSRARHGIESARQPGPDPRERRGSLRRLRGTGGGARPPRFGPRAHGRARGRRPRLRRAPGGPERHLPRSRDLRSRRGRARPRGRGLRVRCLRRRHSRAYPPGPTGSSLRRTIQRCLGRGRTPAACRPRADEGIRARRPARGRALPAFQDWTSPEGEVFNSGGSDRGFLARFDYLLGGGNFSVGWQSDFGPRRRAAAEQLGCRSLLLSLGGLAPLDPVVGAEWSAGLEPSGPERLPGPLRDRDRPGPLRDPHPAAERGARRRLRRRLPPARLCGEAARRDRGWGWASTSTVASTSRPSTSGSSTTPRAPSRAAPRTSPWRTPAGSTAGSTWTSRRPWETGSSWPVASGATA